MSDRSYKELLDILASVPEIEQAVLYGSRARGDYWRSSDVDLSLSGSHMTRHTLRVLNDKLYESHIPLFFDTHIFSEIKIPAFRNNVLRDGITVYQKGKETNNK